MRIPSLRYGADYAAAVKHYTLHHRAMLHAEMSYFVNQPSFAYALYYAVSCVDHRGKRFSHQRRLAKSMIPASLNILQNEVIQLAGSLNFEALLARVERALLKVVRAGDLYKYDIALRMGAHLGIYPTCVFLQTGAYEGAKRISNEYERRSVEMAEFPNPFRCLAPFEMENLLCIYKTQLLPREA